MQFMNRWNPRKQIYKYLTIGIFFDEIGNNMEISKALSDE